MREFYKRKRSNVTLIKKCHSCGELFYPKGTQMYCSDQCQASYWGKLIYESRKNEEDIDIKIPNVYWYKTKRAWIVELSYQAKKYQIGHFKDLLEAIKIRDIAIQNKKDKTFIEWYNEYKSK